MKPIKFFLSAIIVMVGLSSLSVQAESLNDKQVETLLSSGFSSTELQAQVKAKGYTGAADAETFQRLKKAGADADLILLLKSKGDAVAMPPNTDSKTSTTANFTNSIGMEISKHLSATDYIHIAETKAQKKDFKGAISDCNQALALDPTTQEKSLTLGLLMACKMTIRDFDGALADANENIKIDPKNALHFYGRGIVKKSMNDLDGAIADLNEAVRLIPELPEELRSVEAIPHIIPVRDRLIALKNTKPDQTKDADRALLLESKAASEKFATLKGKDMKLPLGNAVELELVWVPAGYWVGKYEVTQQEYEAVIGSNPAMFRGKRRPVEQVSWNNAMEFCKKVTGQARSSGGLPVDWQVTLPTEKQWEYFVADATLNDAVVGGMSWNIDEISKQRGTMPVGSKGSNRLGLYDVRGNVSELCADWFDKEHTSHTMRGGSWDFVISAEDLKVTYRDGWWSDRGSPGVGFRVVLAPAN
ncbi:MAG: SUMF1/EgtB/PvdO family nonheme iron enzyme [Verrucomicrobiota bacterium]